jgi:DNA-binding GntR family transcriptional regulator
MQLRSEVLLCPAPTRAETELPVNLTEPIRRRTLHDEVVSRLRDMIIEGVLPSGSRLNETELGERLGVSRTPLREAVKTLASEGLIDLVPSKGSVVRRFTLADVRDMLEALKAIEQFAARLGCQRAGDAEVERIVVLHAEMLSRYRDGNRLSYYKLNQEIHTAIVGLAGNATLAEMHHTLQARLKRIRYVGNGRPDRWAAAVAEHEIMIEALRRRDGERLAEVLGLHMDQTLTRVADAI